MGRQKGQVWGYLFRVHNVFALRTDFPRKEFLFCPFASELVLPSSGSLVPKPVHKQLASPQTLQKQLQNSNNEGGGSSSTISCLLIRALKMGEILDLLRDLTSPSPPDGWGEGSTDKLVSEFNNYDDDVVINDEEVAAFNTLGGGAADPLDLMGNCQSKARSHKADHYWPRKKCNKATFR